MLWFALHWVQSNYVSARRMKNMSPQWRQSIEWTMIILLTPIPRRDRFIMDGRLMINSFSLLDSSWIFVRLIDRLKSLLSSSSSWSSWIRFYIKFEICWSIWKNHFFSSLTLVFEFSSLVMTVRIGRFFSLSDRQSGKGRPRRDRCRIWKPSSVISFSLLSQFGVTVERVLSNNLISCSEWES